MFTRSGVGAGRRAVAVLVVLVATLATSVVAFADAPDDPGFAQQWALSGSAASIHAPQAWCSSTGGVLVADVDTGADFGHADLAGKLVAGARFTSGRGDESQPDGVGQAAVQDDHGHGTMTTGIMVADTNNGVGIAGVAPSARALIVKVLVPDNKGSASGYGNDVAAGIAYAADYPGVRVINLSIGSDVPTLPLGINLFSNP
ncbi:MAG: S8 family serine peptidase, partial [Candidatus Dormibacteraeota bacterium]|nr:S8 family serine peptidase [Candidatus Dormibacteraeota bacterium]